MTVVLRFSIICCSLAGIILMTNIANSRQATQEFNGQLVIMTQDMCVYIRDSQTSWTPVTTNLFSFIPSPNGNMAVYITQNSDGTGAFYHYDIQSRQSTLRFETDNPLGIIPFQWSPSGDKFALTYNPVSLADFNAANDQRQIIIFDFAKDAFTSQTYNLPSSRYLWLADDTLLISATPVATNPNEIVQDEFYQLNVLSPDMKLIPFENTANLSNQFNMPEIYQFLQERLVPYDITPAFPMDRGYPSYFSISPRQDLFVRVTAAEVGGFNDQCRKYDVALHGITVDSMPQPIFQPPKDNTLSVDDIEWLVDDTIVFAHQNSALCDPNDSQTRLMRVLPDGTVTVLIDQMAPLHEVYHPYAPSPDNTQIAWIDVDKATVNLTDLSTNQTTPFFSAWDLPPAAGCTNAAFNGLFWLPE